MECTVQDSTCNDSNIESKLLTIKKKKFALTGSRTRISCLEGNYANRYTTNASYSYIYNFFNLFYIETYLLNNANAYSKLMKRLEAKKNVILSTNERSRPGYLINMKKNKSLTKFVLNKFKLKVRILMLH